MGCLEERKSQAQTARREALATVTTAERRLGYDPLQHSEAPPLGPDEAKFLQAKKRSQRPQDTYTQLFSTHEVSAW